MMLTDEAVATTIANLVLMTESVETNIDDYHCYMRGSPTPQQYRVIVDQLRIVARPLKTALSLLIAMQRKYQMAQLDTTPHLPDYTKPNYTMQLHILHTTIVEQIAALTRITS